MARFGLRDDVSLMRRCLKCHTSGWKRTQRLDKSRSAKSDEKRRKDAELKASDKPKHKVSMATNRRRIDAGEFRIRIKSTADHHEVALPGDFELPQYHPLRA